MRFDDLLRVSFRQVLRQHLRNLWVVLAITLGTGGFIVVITMGQDVKEMINQDLEILGRVTVVKATFEGDLEKHSVSRHQSFKWSTFTALQRMPGVNGASLIAFKYLTAFSKNLNRHSFHVMGLDEFYWDVTGLKPLSGMLFGHEEVAGRKLVCVLGADLAKKIFGHENVTGSLLEIENDLYQVIGVLERLGTSDVNHRAFIPITTARDRINFFGPSDKLYLRCHSWDDVERVASAIPGVVRAHQSDEGLRVWVSRGPLKRVKKMAWWIETFVNLAVFATLILGGFGIWNIMMNSIRSRTQEIGLKKAMGAKDRDIMAQFLAEALCLSLTGALVGIAVGRAAVEFVCFLLGSRPSEDLFILCVGMGLVFAVLLGIGAGISPSLRASRMEVVSAVRYE